MADAHAELGFGNAHDGQLSLHSNISHESALNRDDIDVIRQGLDFKVGLLKHGHIKVLILDARRSSHTERNKTITHEARPPNALPQFLLLDRHGSGPRVAMQTDSVGQGYGHTHPVPSVLLIIRSFIPVRHEHEALDKDETVELIIEIIKELDLTCEYGSSNMGN